MKGYALLDSGNMQKLEQFGPYTLVRPCSQAVWKTSLPQDQWNGADGYFSREERWHLSPKIPEEWTVSINEINFRIHVTEFGHVGLFAEQIPLWNSISQLCKKRPLRVLNLFAYSGGSTLAAALHGAEVCHVDASKGMISWARHNAQINHLDSAPIRWIVEDVIKFLIREARRGSTYDAIILDPPSFGRGNKGEVFKIEENIQELLYLCKSCLSQTPSFFLLSAHTPGFTPVTLSNLLQQSFKKMGGTFEADEMLLQGLSPSVFPIPSGAFAIWRQE